MKAVRVSSLIFCGIAVYLAFAGHERLTRAANPDAASQAQPGFVLVAHGGAGSYDHMTPEMIEARRAAMVKAIRAGYGILAGGGKSLDAVEATIRVMEDSGLFDAGRGAYYTREGVAELDASLMDGKTLAVGSVASVKHIANPIHLARLIMEQTPHVMLVGAGAEEFARSQGIELVSPFYFYNQRMWEIYEKAKSEEEKKKAMEPAREQEHGTVGVVALDQAGNLAAGTSTGGTNMKLPGRVGDSPIIGAGTYANNESCGISGTGVGEFYIRNIVAADICERVRYLKVSLDEAADDVVMKELVQQKAEGGVIGLDPQGNVVTTFNTTGMMNGTVRADGKIIMKGWSKTAEPVIESAKE
ncbi:MAG TPA: isoaspartyl peptidase/L-asparaginase [Candidatus Acidoferrales bacterium]|nr:isoaspartyl peptidase/L-asparaginase [Candidatus Acidoferrales bacterium]